MSVFPPNEMVDSIVPADVIAELEREIVMRSRVYPRWVKDGRLNEQLARMQIAALRKAILIIKEAHPPAPPRGSLL